MKKAKWFASIALAAMIVFTTACGQNNNSSTSPSASTNASQNVSASIPPLEQGGEIDYGPFCGDECRIALKLEKDPASYKGKVGFVVASLTFGYGVALKSQTEAHAKAYFPNIEFIVGDGQNDPVVQMNVVEDFISKGIDVLIINAVEKDALARVVKKAMDAGIKVISVDRTVNTEVTTTIKGNDIDLGLNAGGSLVKTLGGKGNVVELQGSASASPTIDRNAGLMQSIKDHPDIKVIASQHADYDQSKALKVMEDILQRFPSGKIDAVYAHADMMAEGALQAIKAAGREKEIKIISIDGQESVLQKVANGEIESTTIYPVVSPMGIIAAAKALAGEELPEFIKLETPTVTKDNASQYFGLTFE
jgi:ribose transport system substrate-binding protein